MVRYLDTGCGAPSQCLGAWFQENVVRGIKGFYCQFGYYGYRALYPFEEVIRETAAAGNRVRLVFGSNKASLCDAHLRWTFDLIDGARDAVLAVVVFSNAEFHPKTACVEREDGSMAAVVGSGNLTEGGMGLNVEAAMSLDTKDGDDRQVIVAVASAVERWCDGREGGAFHIRRYQDIDALRDANLIDVAQPQPIRPGGGAGGRGDKTGPIPGRRAPLWTPSRKPVAVRRAKDREMGKRPGKKAARKGYAYPERWCKLLKSSDAQWVRTGTNPTGKLRLAQAGHPIDQRRYFRYQLFGGEAWSGETRQGKSYEVAQAEFEVTIRNQHLGRISLVLDHAAHREAGQNNVPTVLAWGTTINRILASESHIGDWVIMARGADGTFKLIIQSEKPTWAR